MKIFYPSIKLIPTSQEIINIAKEESFVIELPKEELPLPEDETNLVAKLNENLSDNYSVFKSGSWKETITITIKPLIKTEDIIKYSKTIKACIEDYITISNKLINNNSSDKNMTQNWQLVEEHGEHNRYYHKKSGQILETNAFPFTDIKYIDPYFWGIFIKTSLKYTDLKKIITDEFHDSIKILDYLKHTYEKS